MNNKLKKSLILSVMGIGPVILLYLLAYIFDYYTLIGPFCSTAAIVVTNPNSEYCRPRNIFGSYLITIILVIFFANFLDDHNILIFLLIFALSIFLLNHFNVFHPSATAVTIVEFFVNNNPEKMIIYGVIATFITTFFSYTYSKIHAKYLKS